jgi:hypothetical protein
MGVTLTLNETTHQLAREEILKLAAKDLSRASEQIEELAGEVWPVRFHQVGDAQAALELVRESLAAIEQIGWPDTDLPPRRTGGG